MKLMDTAVTDKMFLLTDIINSQTRAENFSLIICHRINADVKTPSSDGDDFKCCFNFNTHYFSVREKSFASHRTFGQTKFYNTWDQTRFCLSKCPLYWYQNHEQGVKLAAESRGQLDP